MAWELIPEVPFMMTSTPTLGPEVGLTRVVIPQFLDHPCDSSLIPTPQDWLRMTGLRIAGIGVMGVRFTGLRMMGTRTMGLRMTGIKMTRMIK